MKRNSDPILEPEEPWERKGDVPRVVFSCGQVLKDGTLSVYYGGADRVVAVVTCSLTVKRSPIRPWPQRRALAVRASLTPTPSRRSSLEYGYDTARLANAAGLANNYVTNGYMTDEILETFLPYLDAVNVDLKAFRAHELGEDTPWHISRFFQATIKSIELMNGPIVLERMSTNLPQNGGQPEGESND